MISLQEKRAAKSATDDNSASSVMRRAPLDKLRRGDRRRIVTRRAVAGSARVDSAALNGALIL